MVNPDFSMTFVNSSNIEFTRKSNDAYASEDPALTTVIQFPAEKLSKLIGVSRFSWTQSLSSVATGDVDGMMIWRNATNGYWFGVQLHQPLQVFGIGIAPYYTVAWYDGSEDHSSFIQACKPHETFEFPVSLGFKATIRPTPGNASLFLVVSIRDLPVA